MALFYQSPSRSLPEGYTFRGATLKDVPIVVQLLIQRQFGSSNNSSRNRELLMEWQTRQFNPAMDVRLVFDQREHLIGYIEVWTMINQPAYPWLWGCVHPEFEGRGVGTALLRWAEARVQLALEMHPSYQPIAARFGALHNLQSAQTLCAALGWQPVPGASDAMAQTIKRNGALRLTQETVSSYDIYEKEMLPSAA